jgi:hypothetical protein
MATTMMSNEVAQQRAQETKKNMGLCKKNVGSSIVTVKKKRWNRTKSIPFHI